MARAILLLAGQAIEMPQQMLEARASLMKI